VDIVRRRHRKMTNTAPTPLCATPAASQSFLSLHNYTPLAKLVGTDKNRQLHYQTNANSHLPR